jgi:hypothetical protein
VLFQELKVFVLMITIGSISEILQIVFVGPNQNTNGMIPKVNCLRKNKLISSCSWLIQNNASYRDISLDSTLEDERFCPPIEHAPSMEDVMKNIPLHSKFDIIDDDMQWVRNSNGDLEDVYTTSGMFSQIAENEAHSNIIIKASVNNWLSQYPKGLLAIGHGRKEGTLKNINGDVSWITDMYPILFPYGITGPEVER